MSSVKPGSAAQEEAAAALIGKSVGRYRVTRQIGRGGMGAVFEAVHESLGQKTAVKVLHPEYSANPDIVKRFFNEARAAAMVQHPGLVKIFDYGQLDDGTIFLLMEYIDGELLRDRIQRRGGRLALAEALTVARQLASALEAAHARGIVHRDLKPGNVIVVRDAETVSGERVKLLDFGVAKVLATADGETPAPDEESLLHTSTGMLLGTPTYMAPEQCRGAGGVDQKADVYSLGVMLFQMLAGRPPFSGLGAGDLIAAHITLAPPPLREASPETPPEVALLVAETLLQSAPARPLMSQVALRLERLGNPAVSTPAPEPAPPPAPAPAPEPTPRRSMRAWLLLFLALPVAAVAFWLLMHMHKTPPPSPAPIIVQPHQTPLPAPAPPLAPAPKIVPAPAPVAEPPPPSHAPSHKKRKPSPNEPIPI